MAFSRQALLGKMVEKKLIIDWPKAEKPRKKLLILYDKKQTKPGKNRFWSCRKYIKESSTGLHTQKAYTHSGTSSNQCVHQISSCIYSFCQINKSRQQQFLCPKQLVSTWTALIYAFCLKLWYQEVPQQVYTLLTCKLVYKSHLASFKVKKKWLNVL